LIDMIGRGCVIAIGGNEDKRGTKAILRTFVERAGGAEARIVIVPSASAEPERRGGRYAVIFRKLGAASAHILHTERKLTRDELMLITNATGIFVTGGDQERLMMHLRSSGADEAIRESVRNGAVYAGTSAGAAAISRTMISGSTRRRSGELVHLSEGLGLIDDVVIDQHFSERRRLTRLIEATSSNNLVGVGIDENTAAIWESHGELLIAGAGEVTVVQPEERTITLHVLGDDDRFTIE
jgi:cyanophycinase